MMSKEREIEILKDYVSGMKTAELISKHKVSTSSIAKLLKKYHICSKNAKDDDREESIYNEFTIIQAKLDIIATRHNISIAEVKKIIIKKRNEHIINDYLRNVKINDICIKYNLSNMAIYKILNANHIERKHLREKKQINKTLLSDGQKAEIVEKYNNNSMSVEALMDIYNITKYQLYKVLYAAGCELRSPAHFSEQEKAQIIKDYKAGKTITDLSYKYKASRALISLIVKD